MSLHPECKSCFGSGLSACSERPSHKVWQWANCPAMVGCDGCVFWVHADCDHTAKEVGPHADNARHVI
jgi:hypothetical protein